MRAKLGFSLCLAALASLVAMASGVFAVTPAPPASAKLLDCNLKQNAATFRGTLQAIDRTDQMWVRFTLLQRSAGGSFEKVDAPALKAWQKSRRGVSRFGYNQTVKGLKSGRAYRALVKFRWYAANGALIRSFERRSPVCSLGGGANLAVLEIRSRPGPSPGTSTYSVAVENQGSTDVERAVVQLVVDGSELDAGEITLLRRGETSEVQFTGPVCQQVVRAVVDPRNAIVETDERDNAIRFPCATTG